MQNSKVPLQTKFSSNRPNVAFSAPSFGDLPICGAVDTSGGTSIPIQKKTDSAVAISTRLPPQNKNSVRLLPWNSKPYKIISLPADNGEVMLKSGGATQLLRLFHDRKYFEVLRECGLCLLLTAGVISDKEVRKFASTTSSTTSKLCPHGIPCSRVVFGNISRLTPGNAKISVGIATYAQSPQSLFLFQDITSGLLYTLQTKGYLKALLPIDREQQGIESAYTWNNLPLTPSKVSAVLDIPPSMTVSANERALLKGRFFKLRDLYNGCSSTQELERGSAKENLGSIVKSELGRGKDPHPMAFPGNTPLTSVPDPPIERPDVHRAPETIISTPVDLLHRQFLELLLGISFRSHIEAPLKDHDADVQNLVSLNRNYANLSRMALSLWKMRIEHGRREGSFRPSLMWGSSQPNDNQQFLFTPTIYTEAPEFDDCFLPSLYMSPAISRGGTEFRGKCSLCHLQSVLAILTKAPSSTIQAALCNSPEHGPIDLPVSELFSASIVCDVCAYHLVEVGLSPSREPIVGAIALVDIETCEEAWTNALDASFNGFFRRSATLQRLDSIFNAKVNKRLLAGFTGDDVFRKAMIWMNEELSGFLGPA